MPSYYFIRSRLNGLVLDVEGDNRNPGARVVMWNQKPGNCDNQLWYDDFATGTIRSKLNDFCLDWNGKLCLSCVIHFYILRKVRQMAPLYEMKLLDTYMYRHVRYALALMFAKKS